MKATCKLSSCAGGLLLALLSPLARSQLAVVHNFSGCCGFGWAVANLADIDNDGTGDIAVGANDSGQIYVYSGRSGAPLHTFTVPQSDFGYSLANAGDTDGDGRNDIVGGAPTHGGTGTVRVYSGRTGGLLLNVPGPRVGARFGVAVASAGDFNSDGKSDLLVGADGANAAYVISGADGAVLLTLAGTGRFGSGVGRLPDVDKDGHDELMVSSPKAVGGRVQVYSGASATQLFELSSDAGGAEFGTAFLAAVGDVNGDSAADIYVGDYGAVADNGAAYVYSGKDGSRLHKFTGTGKEGLGTGRGAGDVDGDGRADLAVGSYNFNGGIGRVRVFSGRTGQVLASYQGAAVGGNFGFDVVGIGDVNGDRKADLLVSSQPLGQAAVIAGTVVSSAPPVSISPAIAGAWFNPATSGQGFLLDARAADQFIFIAWFTYEETPANAPAKIGSNSQRWLTLQGNYQGDTADLPIFNSFGGNFNMPGGVTTRVVGNGKFRLLDCNHGTLAFTFTDGPAATIPLQRILPVADIQCMAGRTGGVQ